MRNYNIDLSSETSFGNSTLATHFPVCSCRSTLGGGVHFWLVCNQCCQIEKGYPLCEHGPKWAKKISLFPVSFWRVFCFFKDAFAWKPLYQSGYVQTDSSVLPHVTQIANCPLQYIIRLLASIHRVKM